MNFAVVGCGMLAQQSHIPNLVAIEDACFHTACDINEDNLRKAAAFHPKKTTKDFREAIAEPEVEALIVATTEAFRRPIIEAAAQAGKPVYTEKPLADTFANALAIQKIVEESGIPFCVGHNRRAAPAMRDAQKIFTTHLKAPQPQPWRFERPGWETMEVGSSPGTPVLAIRINDDWKSWKPVHLQNDLNRRVGLLLSEGTHFVDLANWFLGAEPVSVLCTGQGVLNHVIVIHYAHGGMAVITMAGTGTFGYPKELLEAIGEGGIVVCEHMLEVRTAGIAGAAALTCYPMLHDRHPDIGVEGGLSGWLAKKRAACEEAVVSRDSLRQFAAEPDKGHQRMLREFIREIRGERKSVCPVSAAVLATQVCLAAAKSYLEGRKVDVAEITPETKI